MKPFKIIIIAVFVCWFAFVGSYFFWNFGPSVEVMGFKTKAATKIADYRDGSLGIERYRMLLDATEAYKKSNPGVSAAISEGKELAPVDYLNAHLKRENAKFRVRRIDGMQVDFYEIS